MYAVTTIRISPANAAGRRKRRFAANETETRADYNFRHRIGPRGPISPAAHCMRILRIERSPRIRQLHTNGALTTHLAKKADGSDEFSVRVNNPLRQLFLSCSGA